MPHYNSLDKVNLNNTWLTIGIFDGVHLGHQSLLTRLVDGAHADNCQAAVLTFSPHPAVVLGGQADFKYLTTPAEQAALLDSLGVDAIITQTFDRAFAAQTAEEFMRRAARTLGLRHLVLGHDTALGRGREGNAARLAELGRELDYSVETVDPVRQGDVIISSSAIRTQVRVGAVAEAAGRLGRPYTLSGTVIHGDGRGRHINVPTANIDYPGEKLIPANGIYAAWVWVDGVRHPSATNIGINPTFTPERKTASIEAHLLDFHGDLYGQYVNLEFVERLRDEMKFNSVGALITRIQADIAQARNILH